MTLMHGWINTREQSEQLKAVYDWLEKHGGFRVCKHGMNGELVYQIFSSRNGRSPSWEEFKLKLELALKSEPSNTYGLIYIYDESSIYADQWLIWRIANNKIDELVDIYLSPYGEIIDKKLED